MNKSRAIAIHRKLEDRKFFKDVRAYGGCLGTWGLRRTWQAAKSDGELLAGFDPSISEWGNLVAVIRYGSKLKVG